MDWFEQAGLGLFIHWDHAGSQGYEIGWPLVGGLPHLPSPVPDTAADYHRSSETFDPVNWDPDALADRVVLLGAKYAVFTTRHHSGWASWPSKTGGFSIASSPYGQRGGDLVRDYVEAFRARGIRIGLYYSLSDWHHPDYMSWTDEQRPYNERPRRGDEASWQRYRQYVKDQLSELLTEYGTIDLLWFDGHWERTQEEWGAEDLVAHIRGLAPDIVMNDRIAGAGNYSTPEQYIPHEAPDGPWECCITINDTWGYVPADTNFKSAYELVRNLIEVRTRRGNLLMNVGPMPDGTLSPTESSRLDAVTEWMAANRESVTDIVAGLEGWQFYGPTSAKGDKVYLHLLAWPTETLSVRGVPVKRVVSAKILSTGEQLTMRHEIPFVAKSDADPMGELFVSMPRRRPEDVVPVVELTIAAATN
jgi:alpha-L-fucosidase